MAKPCPKGWAGEGIVLIMKKDSGKNGKLKKYIAAGIMTACVCAYAVLDAFAKRRGEEGVIDDHNGYMKKETKPDSRSAYETCVKPLLDKVLSFAGLILLGPVYGVIGLAVYMDDPGPVIFRQKRVGKDGHYFYLHKFRTMSVKAPHDVPTHLLENPEEYITRIGKILRKTSLDELPQIWDIFRGKMSVIGPRPALWNQEDLVAEREKYGANHVLPGLTGLAQIKGRDELEIEEKAKLDGEYVKKLRRGGAEAFYQDAACFAGTIGSVVRHEGVVEGGTGAVFRNNKGRAKENRHLGAVEVSEAGFQEYGNRKKFHINIGVKRKVLITGAGSYIGEAFRAYAERHYPQMEIHTVDMRDNGWRKTNFTGFDTVFHVAGIAHADVGSVNGEEIRRYYEVNRDLAIETAKAAKEADVKQFIFLSSMIIYGDSAACGKRKVIDEHTIPSPANFYGDSKWQGDKEIRGLSSPGFQTAVLRLPMVYGKNSRGNYKTLSRIAKMMPVFPDIKNQRSMLYIDNLCEFLCLLICSGEGGVYFPQNREFVNTTEMAGQIRAAAGKKTIRVRLLNPAVKLGACISGRTGRLVNKAFGNCVYSQSLSEYDGLDYQKIGFKESIKVTESGNGF